MTTKQILIFLVLGFSCNRIESQVCQNLSSLFSDISLDNPTKLKELTMAPNKILIDFGEMNNLICKENEIRDSLQKIIESNQKQKDKLKFLQDSLNAAHKLEMQTLEIKRKKKKKNDALRVTLEELRLNVEKNLSLISSFEFKVFDKIASKQLKLDSASVTLDTILLLKRKLEHIDRKTFEIFKESKHLSIIDTSEYKIIAGETNKLLQELQENLNKLEKWKSLFSKLSSGPIKKDALGTLPQITSINKKVTPTISLIGATNFNGNHRIGIFTGSTNGDTLSTATMIVPELSKVGIYAAGFFNLSYMFAEKYKNRFGINYNIQYNDKATYNRETNSNFDFSQFQLKSGLEYIVFANVLSLYGNYTFIKPLTNVDLYKQAFKLQGSSQDFLDFGVKLFVQPGESSVEQGFGIFIDLNFMVANESIRKFQYANDNLITSYRLGIQKSFR